MRYFIQAYAPNFVWDFYLWTTNWCRAREKYPNPLRYMAFRRRLRRQIWGS